MRAVIQRVKEASVTIDDSIHSSITGGLCILLGIADNDTDQDILYIIDKIMHLRIFRDAEGKLNRSIQDSGGELLVVSQFTLYGDARRGRRPSYLRAAGGEHALNQYGHFLKIFQQKWPKQRVKTGVFGAMMEISLINDGPVTILLDSEKKF